MNHDELSWPPRWWKSRGVKEILATSKIQCHRRARFGSRLIDSAVGGGIPSKMITEISGEAGSGKTQAAMSLIAECLIDPQTKGTGVLLISTEGQFPVERLLEILSHRLAQNGLLTTIEAAKGLLNSVFIQEVGDQEDLWTALTDDVPYLMSQMRISMVVIDSIAAVFRLVEMADLVARAENLHRVAAVLKRIATMTDAAVLCINQVAAAIGNDQENEGNAKAELKPALGLAWQTCVDVRLTLEKEAVRDGCCAAPGIFRLVHSPMDPPAQAAYAISACGLIDWRQ